MRKGILLQENYFLNLQFVRDGYGESFWRYFGNKKWEKSENG